MKISGLTTFFLTATILCGFAFVITLASIDNRWVLVLLFGVGARFCSTAGQKSMEHDEKQFSPTPVEPRSE